MNQLCFLIIIIALSLSSPGQQRNIDSLRKLLKGHDTTDFPILKQIAGEYTMHGNDSGIIYVQKALDLANELGLKQIELNLTEIKVQMLYRTGNYAQALQAGLDYLKRSESLKDTLSIFNSNRSIMMTYEYLPNSSDKIIEYANKLRDLVNSGYFKDPSQKEMLELIGYINHALAYYQMRGQKDSVLYFSQRSFEMSTHLKDDQLIALSSGNLADINEQLGNEELALSYYKLGKTAAERSERSDLNAIFTVSIAELFQRKGMRDSALSYIHNNRETLEKVADPSVKLEAYNKMSGIFENDHQLDSAFKYLKLGVKIRDSLFSQQKLTSVEAIASSEQLRQYELQQKELKEKQERKLNLQFLVIAVGLITFAILFLIFSYSIIANDRLIRFLGTVGLLVFFELINLFIHPFLENSTNHSAILMLMIMVLIAALLVPAHHYLQKWVSSKLVEKNKKIRLAAAKKTIAKLEGEQS